MRFKEIISERGRNQGPSDGDPFAPEPGSVAAAQADAARIAQGDKNLNAIKGFFGMKPTELKDAPPGTSIDPIQRSRMGYKPATQKEIADFQAANPNYGKVVGGDGKPIKTGDGSDLVSGGGAAMVQTAQAAAPQTKGDAHAGQGGYNTDVGRIPGAAHAGQQGYTPAAAAPAAAPADDSAARAAAAAAAGQTPIRDTGDNTQLKSQTAQLQQLAGITPISTTADAKGDILPPAGAAPAAAEPVVTAAELGSQEFPMTPGPEVPATTAALPVRPGQQTSGQAATPPGKKAAPKISPAIVGYASSMGLYKNGQPDPVAIKAFQRKNNLTADGIIGGNTSAAILSAAKPGMAGSSRGQQGGAPAPYPGTPTVPPTAPRRDSNTQRQTLAKTMPGPGGQAAALPAPQTGAAGQAARAAARAAGQAATPPAGGGQVIGGGRIPQGPARAGVPPVTQAVKESQDIQRMRFLAGLSKD